MEQKCEYINKQVLQSSLERKKCGPANKRYIEGWNDAVAVFKSMVHGAKAEDVAPVKHGAWIMRGGKFRCSVCDARANWKREGGTGGFSFEYEQVKSTYCHNCGAKMDGGMDD